ncbi:MAG: 4Fe-4S binding protein [Syntrophomonadaceae bacterium]|nr:4Fe-4S binding protein [Bacillota bacterium]NLM87254.1 4Fe-4S binding protein [Syntrophomonadaceae bacterium]HAA08165.1 ferredoxin [Syntrophomonas sp.]HQA50429.1 4Fe-4S binding protein [Syntrophomonadaceae bacterium]HQD91334.1 4Fe-4S binding protein [Syntrophomonadaceae bacterium]
MVYVINEKECVNCGLCADVCPVNAIGIGKYSIDPETCIGCGECADSCPAEAIHADSQD